MGSPGTGSSRPPAFDVGGFAAHVERHSGSVVLAVAGDVDMVTAPQLEPHVDAALTEAPEVFVIDLTEVRLLGSAGLAVLVTAQNQAPPGTSVRIVAGGRTTLRVLELTGLDQTLAIYPTRERALAE